jgi:Flp pilus assembly protein TadB
MPSGGASSGHDLDRELNELLQELRVILPGIQVLFAFLLVVPFSNRFSSAGETTETAYFVAFAATTLASIFAIAPGVQHRLRWRQHDKEALLRTGNRQMLIATALIGTGIVSVAFLITDYLYGATIGGVLAALVAVLAFGVWWALPMLRQHSRDGGAH